jgi:RNA-directed DNA polymerase
MSKKKLALEAKHSELFQSLFKLDVMLEVFGKKFRHTPTRGTDRVNGYQFAHRKLPELTIASEKCLAGRYRFAPYLEKLRLKGRGKQPRVISIPTVRDRVVLHQLKQFLSEIFPESVPKRIAADHIRVTAEKLSQMDPEVIQAIYVCKCDIKNFYDEINHTRLLSMVRSRLTYEPALRLLRSAISTATVEVGTRRRRLLSANGVPQGLAISNLLAAIYLSGVDAAMGNVGVQYVRYVDDVLIYGEKETVFSAHRSFVARLRARNLKVYPLDNDKSHMGPLADPFDYLGYRFKWPGITVKDSTVERFLESIAARFSEYLHNKGWRERQYKLREQLQKEIFLLELNERITGAVSENRKYGWVAYYSQINDLTILYKLDWAVAAMFRKMPDFGKQPPPGLKKFSRAYHEMKFSPKAGYVRNYDIISSAAEKLLFLQERGRIRAEEDLTEDEIDRRFESYRRRSISQMQADEGIIS